MVTWKQEQDIENARSLRIEFATEVEKTLWTRLRSRQLGGAKFRRQHPVGPYVVDFICLEQGLVIELDGGQHGLAGLAARDDRRTASLNGLGLRVVRFWNNEITDNIEGVMEAITRALAEAPSPPGPLSRKRARVSTPTTEPAS